MISRAVRLRAEAASRTGELAYVLKLKGIMKGFHAAAMAGIRPHMPHMVGRRFDATRWGMGLEERLHHFIRQLEPKVGVAFDSIASQVARQSLATQTELLDFRPSSSGVPNVLQRARGKNVELVTRAAEDYAQDLHQVMDDPKTWDLTLEELQALFDERGSVSLSRAALIARDQCYKLNAAVSRQLQENAGADRYIWATCRDERVRPTHRRNEGRTFYWSNPPAETGHPGEDPNCRCLAIPLVATTTFPDDA